MNPKTFLTPCACGAKTTKKYAREHGGKCKGCANPDAAYTGPKCPDCGGPISKADLAKGYHCQACTREADPAGYAAEVRGEYDHGDY